MYIDYVSTLFPSGIKHLFGVVVDKVDNLRADHHAMRSRMQTHMAVVYFIDEVEVHLSCRRLLYQFAASSVAFFGTYEHIFEVADEFAVYFVEI